MKVTGEIQAVIIPDVQQQEISVSSIPSNLGFIIKSECILDFIPVIKDRFNL